MSPVTHFFHRMGFRKRGIAESQGTRSGYSCLCRARCRWPWDCRGVFDAELEASTGMVFDLPSHVAQSSIRGGRDGDVVRIGDPTLEDCGLGLLEFPHSSTRRFVGKPRAGRLSMANSIPYAVLPGLRAELARTMGAECLAQFCHHDFAAADDVLPCVVAGIFSVRDGLAKG